MITDKNENFFSPIQTETPKAKKLLRRFGVGRKHVTTPEMVYLQTKGIDSRKSKARLARSGQRVLSRAAPVLAVRAHEHAKMAFSFSELEFKNTRQQREQQLFSFFLNQEKSISELAIAKLIRQRLTIDIVDRMVDEGVKQQEIYALIAPRRTLTHRRSKQEPLTVEESDRAARMARIIALAESVFSNKEKAMGWLRQAAKRFEGQAPMEMLETDTGSRLVEEALIQIDEGYFA